MGRMSLQLAHGLRLHEANAQCDWSGAPPAGPVADGLVHRGWSLTNVRKLCQGIAFAGPLVCMAACALLLPAPGAVTPLATSLIVGVLSGEPEGHTFKDRNDVQQTVAIQTYTLFNTSFSSVLSFSVETLTIHSVMTESSTVDGGGAHLGMFDAQPLSLWAVLQEAACTVSIR